MPDEHSNKQIWDVVVHHKPRVVLKITKCMLYGDRIPCFVRVPHVAHGLLCVSVVSLLFVRWFGLVVSGGDWSSFAAVCNQ